MAGTRRFLSRVAEPIIGTGADPQAYIKGTGRFIATSAEGRTINNLWTGNTLGRGGRIVAGGLLAGGLGVYGLVGPEQQRAREARERALEEDDIQSLPGTQADGAGYTAYPAINMQDYAPSGDLVFALHNIRHGG